MPNVPSILGRSFVDAQFIMAGAGVFVSGVTLVGNVPALIPTLVFQGASGSAPMLMADNTLLTVDDISDTVDSVANTLPAPYVINQNPPPGFAFAAGQLVIATYIAIGYSVPTPLGNIPVP